VRRRHEKQAIYLGVVAVFFGLVGTSFFVTLAATLAGVCAWHSYQRWGRLVGSSLIAHIRLAEAPIVDALDLHWLGWAQWKAPRTRAYLHAKRSTGDYLIGDTYGLMSFETDQLPSATAILMKPGRHWKRGEGKSA
jgi:hypothetical protein